MTRPVQVIGLLLLFVLLSALRVSLLRSEGPPAGAELLGTGKYEDFEKPEVCQACHVDFAMETQQSMMSQSYTHAWDEIEYFKLALPHAEKDPKVAGVKAGCNGCHAPLAFIAGDIPPPRPEENSRANEGVSCDICHTITGFKGDVPFNFNYTIHPGKTKYGNRVDSFSPYHTTAFSAFTRSPDLCATCHNEQSPYGVWVKSTQLEWKDGPYSKAGVRCQDCHMPHTEGIPAVIGLFRDDVAHHLFPGAHSPSKLTGAVELGIHPDAREVRPGGTVKLTVIAFNQKVGHKIPSGSAEERQLWLTVMAYDAAGKSYHLPVDKKGFEGEEYTISANTPAYQDIGMIMDISGFKGLPRDALPFEGDRVFRLPYFDPQGRMTIAQWNTASLGTDYRIGPREAKIETYTWDLPADIAHGKVRVVAEINYRRLVKSVGDFLGVPEDEMAIQPVNRTESWFKVMD